MSNCSIFVRRMQETNVSPMPFIGLYVAAATLLCTLAMFLNSFGSGMISFRLSRAKFLALNATDKLFGTPDASKLLAIRASKLFALNAASFSSKFFTLNATSLTLLAVATKLAGDLTSPMWSLQDNLAKISSTLFLTTAMGNFISSLGSMSDRDILTNVTALSILVITILADICIQLRTGAVDYSLFPEIIFAVMLLLCMFMTIVCSALTVPAIKKRVESQYQNAHKVASEEEHIKANKGRNMYAVEELRMSISKYWVMAATGSPQFMVARLVTSFFTGYICLLSAFVLSAAVVRTILVYKKWISECRKESDYKWSIDIILVFQVLAVDMFCLKPAIIWLNVMYFRYEDRGIKINEEDFNIESYWTEKLEEWRQSPIPVRIKRREIRKLLDDTKGLILTLCIRVQAMVVMCCKLSCLVSFYVMLPLIFCIYRFRNLLHEHEVSNGQSWPEMDYSCSVILLEGEPQLPKRFLRNVINDMDQRIRKGKMQQPQNLLNLLNESSTFGEVIDFDSSSVPSLVSEEPLNCWTLPVVTLTTIAIALPGIASQRVDWLVSSVDEGLRYASLIEVMDEKCGGKSGEYATDVVWVGVELHKKWLGVDLKRKTREVNSDKEIIQYLAGIAERTVNEFKAKGNKNLVENPLYWPANVLAANSMYRISRTILLHYENHRCQAEEVFGKLIGMLANILAACLANLPSLIASKCSCNAIEERDKSVCDAAKLLGETEDILKFFEKRQLSSVSPGQPLCIDEWRRWMEKQVPKVSVYPTSSGRAPSTIQSNEHVVVQIQA